MYVAPGWRVAPTGGTGKSTQQIPVGDQHKSIMIVVKCPFLSPVGSGDAAIAAGVSSNKPKSTEVEQSLKKTSKTKKGQKLNSSDQFPQKP